MDGVELSLHPSVHDLYIVFICKDTLDAYFNYIASSIKITEWKYLSTFYPQMFFSLKNWGKDVINFV